MMTGSQQSPQPQMPAVLSSYQLSPKQEAAALARGVDVALRAGAGTGKTRTLVGRYLALLAEGFSPRDIVAITYTRKAAREMRNRVRRQIDAYVQQDGSDVARWDRISAELDAARISTIHTFCGEILRSYPAAAGIDPQFTILDEIQSALLREEAIETALAQTVARADLQPLLAQYGEQQTRALLEDLLRRRLAVSTAMLQHQTTQTILAHWEAVLQKRQRALIRALLADPVLDEARRRLRRQEAADGADKREVQRRLAIAALEELEAERLNGTWQHAIERICSINLRGGSSRNWPDGKPQFDTVGEDLQTLRDAWKTAALLQLSSNALDETAADLLPVLADLFNFAASAYRENKALQDALDFDDLEEGAIDLLQRDAAARAYWQSRVQALLVDEFQDTNNRQRMLIRLLCPEPGKLFIVGDAKQSIYRFRGADVTVFQAEQQAIRRQNGRVLDLDICFRAHATLLQGMNDILAPVLGEEDPDRPWHAPFDPLQSSSTRVHPGLDPPFIEMHIGLGTKATALPIAAAALVQRLLPLLDQTDLTFGDVAVLCRGSRSFQYYEDVFDAVGVPYETVSGRGFYDRPEVRDLLNALAVIENPHDDLALAGLLRSPVFGLNDVGLFHLVHARPSDLSLWEYLHATAAAELPPDTADAVAQLLTIVAPLHDQAGRTAVSDILKAFLDQTCYRAGLRLATEKRALRNVDKLLEDAQAAEYVGIGDFLAYLDELRQTGSRVGEARAAAEGAVRIMTVHQAKGLEFPIVILGDAAAQGHNSSAAFLIDEDLGLVPHVKKEDTVAAAYALAAIHENDREEAELARLLYVALTRAEQFLMVNGTVSNLTKKGVFRKTRGWLGTLLAVTGLDERVWEACDATPEGNGRHEIPVHVGSTELHVALYEPGYQSEDRTVKPVAAVVATDTGSRLAAPLPGVGLSLSEEDHRASYLPQVLPEEGTAQPGAPHWLVGILVHEALAQWRFPATDPDFDTWARTRGQGLGLLNSEQVSDAAGRTARMLQHFNRSDLYRDLESAARRLHEVPYSRIRAGTIETGIIDLLAQVNEQWWVVDFKTDYLGRGRSPRTLPRFSEYEGQVRRYMAAVEELLGVTPAGLLYFLNAKAPEAIYFVTSS